MTKMTKRIDASGRKQGPEQDEGGAQELRLPADFAPTRSAPPIFDYSVRALKSREASPQRQGSTTEKASQKLLHVCSSALRSRSGPDRAPIKFAEGEYVSHAAPVGALMFPSRLLLVASL
jgi:hypothetical protein